MDRLIVEEDVGAEGPEHLALGDPSQEEGLVYAHVPGHQGPDDPLVGRGAPGGHQGRAYGHPVFGEAVLDQGYGLEE